MTTPTAHALTLMQAAAALDLTAPRHLEHDYLEHNGAIYMERFYIVRSLDVNVRLHHIRRSDAERDLHDHPWDFTALLLAGAYIDHTPTGAAEYHAGDILHHRAEDAHRLELVRDDVPVWSLVITGPWRRHWGFHTPTGWVHWRAYHGSKGRGHNLELGGKP